MKISIQLLPLLVTRFTTCTLCTVHICSINIILRAPRFYTLRHCAPIFDLRPAIFLTMRLDAVLRKVARGTKCDEKCNCTFLDLFSCTTRYRALCYAFGHAPLAQWLVDAEKDANAQLCFYLPPSASCCPPRCQPAQFV